MYLIAKAADRDDLKLGPGAKLGTEAVDMGLIVFPSLLESIPQISSMS